MYRVIISEDTSPAVATKYERVHSDGIRERSTDDCPVVGRSRWFILTVSFRRASPALHL